MLPLTVGKISFSLNYLYIWEKKIFSLFDYKKFFGLLVVLKITYLDIQFQKDAVIFSLYFDPIRISALYNSQVNRLSISKLIESMLNFSNLQGHTFLVFFPLFVCFFFPPDQLTRIQDLYCITSKKSGLQLHHVLVLNNSSGTKQKKI